MHTICYVILFIAYALGAAAYAALFWNAFADDQTGNQVAPARTSNDIVTAASSDLN